MGTIAAHFSSYLDFATVDGTVSDGGSWVLMAGPFVLALLGLYIVWNLVAASVNGAKAVLRSAQRRTAPVAPVAAIAGPRVASARRAEALTRSAA